MEEICIDVGCSATYTPAWWEPALYDAMAVLVIGLIVSGLWYGRQTARGIKEREV